MRGTQINMIRIATAFQESANPVIWFRATLMDLGFAGLIQEIEKRFGKFVTTLVLLTLLIAIFLWGLQMVGQALEEVERLQSTGSIWDTAKALAIRLGILMLAAGAIFGFMKLRVDALMRKLFKNADEIEQRIAELKRLRERYIQERQEHRAEIDEWNEKLIQKGEELEKLTEKAGKSMETAEELLDEANRKIQAFTESKAGKNLQ